MERLKVPKLVITFPTTTAAMAMDAACDPAWGRLIPIPKEISGGCGLAFCAAPGQEAALMQLMEEKGISYQEKRVILLYGT